MRVLAAASKIQSELAKGKDCGDVYGKLTNFVQTGGDMLKRLNGRRILKAEVKDLDAEAAEDAGYAGPAGSSR